jgi:hypothetical protein
LQKPFKDKNDDFDDNGNIIKEDPDPDDFPVLIITEEQYNDETKTTTKTGKKYHYDVFEIIFYLKFRYPPPNDSKIRHHAIMALSVDSEWYIFDNCSILRSKHYSIGRIEIYDIYKEYFPEIQLLRVEPELLVYRKNEL